MSYANDFIKELRRIKKSKSIQDFAILLCTTTPTMIDEVEFDKEDKSLSFVWVQEKNPLPDILTLSLYLKRVQIFINYGDEIGGVNLSISPDRLIQINNFDIVEPVYCDEIKSEIKNMATRAGYKIKEPF